MRSLCAATSFDKDTLVALGVIFTAVISPWNLGYNFQHNRRASYVTSVTATRLKWIGEIRDHLSRFVVLIYQATVGASRLMWPSAKKYSRRLRIIACSCGFS